MRNVDLVFIAIGGIACGYGLRASILAFRQRPKVVRCMQCDAWVAARSGHAHVS